MGKSRRKVKENSSEEEVVMKAKGKRKIIYVDERDKNSVSPPSNRNVYGKSEKKQGKGKGKVRYVYSSSESDSDSPERVVKRRIKHKLRRKKYLVSDSEDYSSGSYEVGVKRKKRSETTTEPDDSDEVDVVVKKPNKMKFVSEKQVRCGVSERSLKSLILEKMNKASTSKVREERLLPRRKVLRPNNGFGAVTEISSDTYYRSNIQGAMTRINVLVFREDHLRAIKMTPFWCLFEVVSKKDDEIVYRNCHKSEPDIRQIVDTFDVTAERFAIGSLMLALTRSHAELIFGISCGDREIYWNRNQYEKPPWLLRCFGERIRNPELKFVMYRNLIYEKLKELLDNEAHEDVKDCARLVNCYLLASILAPLQNGSISWQLACFMEEFEQMCLYDWSSYVICLLKKQLKETATMKSGGCSLILPFWLCEHTQLIARENEVSFPRFLNWNTNKLHKVLSRVDLGRITKVYKSCLPISKTEMEVLLELKMYRDANSAAYAREAAEEDDVLDVVEEDEGLDAVEGDEGLDAVEGDEGLHGEDVDNSQYVDGDGEEDICTTPSSEAFNGDELHHDDAEPVHDFNQTGSGMVRPRSNDHTEIGMGVSTPPFSLGLTQNEYNGTSVDAIRGGSNESERLGGSFEAQDCPFSSNMRGSNHGENVAEGEKLDQKIAALEMQVEQVRKELEHDRNIFEEKQKNKDDLIVKLRSENEELLRKFAVVEEGPTTTQLYESNAVMAQLAATERIAILEHEKSEMMKLVADLTKQAMARVTPVKKAVVGIDSEINKTDKDGVASTIHNRDDDVVKEERVILHSGTFVGGSSKCGAEDEELERVLETQPGLIVLYNNPNTSELINESSKMLMTPAKSSLCFDDAVDEDLNNKSAKVDKGKGVAVEGEPKSLIVRVKVRNNRKKVVSSPQLNTGELITMHEGYTNEEIARDMELLKACKENPLNMSIGAVKRTAHYIREEIACYCITKGDRHVVFRGVKTSAEVNISGLLKVLHNQRLPSEVIDAWCDLVQDKYAAVYRPAKYTMVFSSLCWDLIHKYSGGDNALFTYLISSHFVKAMDMDTLIFPILAGGEDNTVRNVGEHWTLLKLNISKSKWTFYNSRKTRGADHHYKQSLIVVKYVDAKLREVFAQNRPTNKFRIRPLVMPTIELCAQQEPKSVDCGVILCNNVERILKGTPMLKDQFTLNAAAYYRSKMATGFMET